MADVFGGIDRSYDLVWPRGSSEVGVRGIGLIKRFCKQVK